MNIRITQNLLVMGLSLACTALQAADVFAPVGSKATLSVDYAYSSSGKKHGVDKADSHEWRVKRNASITTTLTSQAGLPMPVLQPVEEGQLAQHVAKAEKAKGMGERMAPVMAKVQSIDEKCGDDQDCFVRETQKMMATMQAGGQLPNMQQMQKDSRDVTTVATPRYQAWRAMAQTSNYQIDEAAQITEFNALCGQRQRCTRERLRKGGGEIPLPPHMKKDPRQLAGTSGVEIDSVKNTLTLQLPVPGALPYAETITVGAGVAPAANGATQKQLRYRVSARDDGTFEKNLTVPLKGGWRSHQSGEQVVMLKGESGDAGQLTVRWRLNVQ